MFSDADLLPLSALQHFIYCPRQCALIHLEQQWTENRFTAEGRAQHDRVDRPEHEIRDGIRTEYAVLLRSLTLGLIGKADAIEFQHHPADGDFKSEISNLRSPGGVFPVEHKRGRPKPTHCDWVQLCAQALCLEEMLGGGSGRAPSSTASRGGGKTWNSLRSCVQKPSERRRHCIK